MNVFSVAHVTFVFSKVTALLSFAFAWFLRFFFMCVWFKCHFSILSCSYFKKGGGCFSFLGVNGLHVKNRWLHQCDCVYIARLTLRYCLAADEREGCNADALFVVCGARYLHVKNLPGLIILFTLTFHIYIHKMCTRKLSSDVNECLVLKCIQRKCRILIGYLP